MKLDCPPNHNDYNVDHCEIFIEDFLQVEVDEYVEAKHDWHWDEWSHHEREQLDSALHQLPHIYLAKLVFDIFLNVIWLVQQLYLLLEVFVYKYRVLWELKKIVLS
jgi:hypothetical protein